MHALWLRDTPALLLCLQSTLDIATRAAIAPLVIACLVYLLHEPEGSMGAGTVPLLLSYPHTSPVIELMLHKYLLNVWMNESIDPALPAYVVTSLFTVQ